MSSAWLKSWGLSWGNSWGSVVTGGGGTVPAKKKKGWANERAAFEASWNLPDEPKERSRPAKKQKKLVAPAVVVDESWRLEFDQLRSAKEKAALDQAIAAQMELAEFEQDEEEAIQVLMMALDYESKVLGIPVSLQSSSFIEV